MKRFFAVVCVAMGLVACGPVASGEEDMQLESSEQELCPATCPEGTRFVQYTWICDNQPTSTCYGGREREFAVCYDSSTGQYVTGGTTCRSRCCSIAAD
jgi:hypothetical protein